MELSYQHYRQLPDDDNISHVLSCQHTSARTVWILTLSSCIPNLELDDTVLESAFYKVSIEIRGV